MSEAIQTGGPAFPMGANEYSGTGPAWGMTLRDYFAAKALAALINHPNKDGENCGKKAVPILARFAYEYADAMIAAGAIEQPEESRCQRCNGNPLDSWLCDVPECPLA